MLKSFNPLSIFKNIGTRHHHSRFHKLWTAMAWILVLINIAPLVWMVWCSLLTNQDILEGSILPHPKSNDIVYIKKNTNNNLLMGTINGQCYNYEFKDGKAVSTSYKDFGTISSTYMVNGDSLWILSADNGLELVDSKTFDKIEEFSWSFIEDSYKNQSHNDFIKKTDFYLRSDIVVLSDWLNSRIITHDKKNLKEITGVNFVQSIDFLEQLNEIKDDRLLRRKVINTMRDERKWSLPVLNHYLSKNIDKLTERQEKITFRLMLAEIFPNALLSFERIPWVDIWADRIPRSNGASMVKMDQAIVFGLWWNDFPGIAILDLATKNTRWVTMRHGLPESAIQHIVKLDKDRVLTVSDLGLSIVNIKKFEVEDNFLFGDYGLPYFDGRQLYVDLIDKTELLISYGQEVLSFDFESKKLTFLDASFMNSISSDITAINHKDGKVFLGTSEGLLIVEYKEWKIASNTKGKYRLRRLNDMFKTESEDGEVLLANGMIRDISFDKTNVILGGIFGHFSIMDENDETVIVSENLPEGNYQLNWRTYEDLWRTIPFSKFLINSLIICFSVVFISIFISALSGYALARYQFPGKEIFGYTVLSTQMIPSILYLIPIFIFYTAFFDITGIKMINTHIGIILTYSAFFIPLSVWLLRGFFATIPKELEEAALIDGCSPIGAFIRVVLPAAKPGIISTAVYVFLLAWDELMLAWVLSTDLTTATIPIGIRMYVGQFGNRFDLFMAASTIATLPAMILFFFLQRNIVSGLTKGAVKG